MSLIFGTSGWRGLLTEMTDLECYLSTRGYLEYLKSISKEDGGIEQGVSVYIAGDRRRSTPRIMRAAAKAITDAGCTVINCGEIPSPTLFYYASCNGSASMMVTGSHIPDDRNGIKPNKTNGEVLKSDEPGIIKQVTRLRQEMSDADLLFNNLPPLPPVDKNAEEFYRKRYLDFFPRDCLAGRKIVVYEHSAVGRDILVGILRELGAEVIREGRSDHRFIPVDTEAIREEDMVLVKSWARQYQPFAVVSTDGDSDRPWLADEKGECVRGDLLGVLAVRYLTADFAAVPVSANDAVVYALKDKLKLVMTRIGSPYVIKAMLDGVAAGFRRVVGWEVNGGFLTQTDLELGGRRLSALPTRDAVLPIICCLALAGREKKSVSVLVAELPRRYTYADKLTGISMEKSREIINKLSSNKLENYLLPYNFTKVTKIDYTDGLRVVFSNNDVLHFRPSGNAPEFRCYANADSPARAREIVSRGLEIISKFVNS